MATETLVYINHAWMTHYRGPQGDKAEGNFSFLKTNDIAYESWNFEPIRRKVYGYVPRSAKINISRLGAKSGDAEVNGVTVVWIARNPRTTKTVIVGWYRNARIHKDAEHRRLKRSSDFEVGYQIEAPTADAVLLPIDARSYTIPTAKEPGNLGQSPVWYGKGEAFNRDVVEYINRGGAPVKRPSKVPRQTDAELRRKVEQAAINHAITYYESDVGGSHRVESVEKDGVGWDLEAFAEDGANLKIEVKGLSGKDLVVELTPNEYAKMLSPEHRADYIIYVLPEALSSEPVAYIFRYDAILSKGKDLVWVSDEGQRLRIEPIIAARLSIA
ncbi:DUF3883 domain-containing protein [Thalassococcus profundi]|uniref:DUF3883 domain-containing protein n=1 Tax=Thalassococcus profundi TaxID=2282382 RepID=A0A369TJ79_9RHOB|nr:DUF3883 domain-containing protein [Thalassococcus profundi]RDD64187.1 DUF3883 domain-containing protein [Thalassococcus profundi]